MTVLAAVAAGCAPALDWREVRPEGAGLVALLPCKPSSQVRSVRLDGRAVQLSLLACTADGLTWALASADVADPARISAVLAELKTSAMVNLGATRSSPLPIDIAGTTPNPASGRVEIIGQLPDGRPVREQVAVFSRGTWVFQVTVLGTELPADAVESFFGGLRFAP